MESDCCGASCEGYEDIGICPACKEHCEFIDVSLIDPQNMGYEKEDE